MNTELSEKLNNLLKDLEACARELYYARSFTDNKYVEIHIDTALKLLGYQSPRDCGLSDSVLIKGLRND